MLLEEIFILEEIPIILEETYIVVYFVEEFHYISNFEDSTLRVPEDLVRRHSDVIFQISTKCPNIKSMDLFDQNMPDKFILMSIANLFPKLEEIQFKTGSKTNETEQMSYHLN